MNLYPPVPFDPSEALSLFAEPTSERFGLSDRVWFYAINTCRAIESFAESSFTIDHVHIQKPTGQVGSVITPARCWIEFIIKAHAFWIDVSPTRVKLWTALADDADGANNRYMVHDGDSFNAESWQALLVEIGRVEGFGVAINHADRLRQIFTQWLIEKKRGDDERGF